MKKVIVAGSRTFNDYKLLEKTLNQMYPEPIQVFCGDSIGADQLGKTWAAKKGYEVKIFFPQWQQDGIDAGFNRNVEMASEADEAIVFWEGTSKGTEHLIRIMKGIEKPVKVINYEA